MCSKTMRRGEVLTPTLPPTFTGALEHIIIWVMDATSTFMAVLQ